MKNWVTKKGYEIFRIPNGGSSCFLIRKEELLILADTGKKGRFCVIWDQVSKIKGAQPLTYIIQTHSHYDHCQNTAHIKALESCKVIGSVKDSAYTRAGYTPLPKGTLLPTKVISWAGRRLLWKFFRHEPFETDIEVGDEYVLQDIRILSTPGHTEGSLSILVDDEIALVGDTMIGSFRKTIFSPFADDPMKMIDSWKKLLNTSCSLFLPVHGREISRAYLSTEYERHLQKFKPNPRS